ncbi:MAG: ABC transporter permease [Bacillota bacterium]
MGVAGAALLGAARAGLWVAWRTRLYEMPVALYFLTWLPNLMLQTWFYTLVALFAGGAELARFALVGSLVRLAALPTCVQTTSHLVADREEGYLAYLVTTPVNLAGLVLGRSVLYAAEAVVTVLVASAVVLPAAGMMPGAAGWLRFCGALAATCLSLSGLGLLVGRVVFRTRYDMVVTSLVVQALAIFCGVVVPVSAFPQWVAKAASLVPLTNGLAAARILLGGGTRGAAGLVAAELGVGLAYWLAGYAVLLAAVRAGRARGSLERF